MQSGLQLNRLIPQKDRVQRQFPSTKRISCKNEQKTEKIEGKNFLGSKSNTQLFRG